MKPLFFGKRVVIMGLGVNGGGLLSAQFCLAHGAQVLVTDLSSEDKLASSIQALRKFAGQDLSGLDAAARLHFRLGSHELEDFLQADFVVKNPGVPGDSSYLKAAKNWTTDLALFLELYPQVPLLAVTGTKGKSSISYALHYILQQYYPKAMLGGNIGQSPLAYALEDLLWQLRGKTEPASGCDLSGASPLVLELSSWQLADLRTVEQSRDQLFFRPQQACLANILKDHQNRYHRFYDYVADKFYIFHSLSRFNALPTATTGGSRSQNGQLLLGTPGDGGRDSMYLGSQFWGDFAARSFSGSTSRGTGTQTDNTQLHYFASDSRLPAALSQGIYWRREADDSYSCYIRESASGEQLFLNNQGFAVLGQHSFQNYCIASYMAYNFQKRRKLSSLTDFCQNNTSLMRQFCGVPFRMEQRGSLKLSKQTVLHFINDTTATMPDATASGITACLQIPQSYCLLILGGTDKDLDPSKLLATLSRHRSQISLFLLRGSGTEALIPLLDRARLAYFGGANQGSLGSQSDLNGMNPENIGIKGFPSLQTAFQAACEAACQAAHDSCTSSLYLLLSPGYASFGMFQNEFDRGRQFNELVKKYLESVALENPF